MRALIGAVLLSVAAFLLGSGCGDTAQAVDDAGTVDADLTVGCGNGVLESGEQCDGTDLADQTCLTAAGLAEGELRCTAGCRRDVTLCHTCGNGVAERVEPCDGPDLRAETCASLDPERPDGELRCGAGCAFDSSGCHRCGDGVVEGPEECDSAPSGLTCQDLGFETADPVGCRPDCRHDRTHCFRCGDGVCDMPSETWRSCPGECGWAEVTQGGSHRCGRRRDGTVWCWGCGSYGQLGDGMAGSSVTPVKVQGLGSAISVATGASASCAVRSNGTVWCWGGNFSGSLGDGTGNSSPVPVQVVGLVGCNRVAAGVASTCALCSGEVWCWPGAASALPERVLGFPDAAVDVAIGETHRCAVLADGTAWCWGGNLAGSLGDGSTTDSASPVPVVGLTGIVEVAAGGHSSCARNDAGLAWCWGDNHAGQLGTEAGGFFSPQPVPVPGTGADVAVAISYSHACAITAGGAVRCWGSNATVQLGDGTAEDRVAPVPAFGLSDGAQLTLSPQSSCAVSHSGVLYCWGFPPFLNCTQPARISAIPDPLCEGEDCGRCGNGLREPFSFEACEGADLGGLACTDFCGYTGGQLACGSDCQPDLAGCLGGPVCGDGVAECPDQICDGADLRGLTCADVGFTSGPLACDSTCRHNTTGCVERRWYLFEDFEGPSADLWSYGGLWAWGEPTYLEGPSAFGGQQCAGTNLSGPYDPGMVLETHSLISPPIDLTEAVAPQLELFYWAELFETGPTFWVSTDDGSTWSALDGAAFGWPTEWLAPLACAGGVSTLVGTFTADWTRLTTDLSAFAGQTIRLRFSLCTDANAFADAPGWYLDDLRVAEPAYLPVRHGSPEDLGFALVEEPFSFGLEAVGGTGNLSWSIQSGTNHAWLSVDPSTGVLSGTPDASALGPVEVTVRVAEPTVAGNFADRTFRLDVSRAVLVETFENGPGAFFEPFDCDWEWGTPSNVGPPSCAGGSAGCVGTVMDGPHGEQISAGECLLVSPPIDLLGSGWPRLVFRQSHAMFNGAGFIVVSTDFGTNWAPLGSAQFDPPPLNEYPGMGCNPIPGAAEINGVSAGWQLQTVDLGAYAGQVILLGFVFCSDTGYSFDEPGWYLDDIMVIE